MNIARMHWEFRQRGNRLNTGHYRDLLPIQIDAKLNEAHLFYLEHFAEVNKLPFEATQTRIDMISTLVESVDLTPVVDGDVYEFRLKDLGYAHLVRGHAACSGILIPVSVRRHDELTRVLKDAFQRPSKKWQRLVGVFRQDSLTNTESSLYVYSEDSWTISSLSLEYIRKPREVFLGGYDTVEYLDCVRNSGSNCSGLLNSTSDPVDSQLPALYHSLLVDIAVMLYYGNTDNPQLYQYVERKVAATT